MTPTTGLAVVPLPADVSVIEQSADPGQFIVLACERAKEWLAKALEHGDIDQIVELKSQAEAIRVYTTQKQLGKDAELSAAEIVRRAERGIGVAIRKGQEAGEIRALGHSDGGACSPYVRGGRVVAGSSRRDGHTTLTSPSEYLGEPTERRDVYAMTDDVSDEQFDDAINQAKAEGSLTRANVVRKVKRASASVTDRIDTAKRNNPHGTGKTPEAIAARRKRLTELASAGNTSRQIAELMGMSVPWVRATAREIGVSLADAAIGKTLLIDSNRIVSETVHTLDGAAYSIGLIDFDALDARQVEGWVTSLTNSLRSLNRFNKRMKEMTLANEG